MSSATRRRATGAGLAREGFILECYLCPAAKSHSRRAAFARESALPACLKPSFFRQKLPDWASKHHFQLLSQNLNKKTRTLNDNEPEFWQILTILTRSHTTSVWRSKQTTNYPWNT